MTLAGAIFLVSILIIPFGAVYRISLWVRGRVDWSSVSMSGVVALPKRYFVDLHDVVARDTTAARMHVFAAGGFVMTSALILVVHVFGATAWLVAMALALACIVMIIGGCLAGVRRTLARPERLSGRGGYGWISVGLICFGVFYLIATLPLLGIETSFGWGSPAGSIVFAMGVFGSFFVFGGMVIGPLRHSFAGASHLAFHPRSERFEGGRGTALKLQNLSDETLGVAKTSDFEWRQLLSFDACVQCGRCEVVCPAHAAGMPLNPKELINNLHTANVEDFSPSILPSPAKSSPGLIGPSERISEDTLWACTTCRACVDACPMMIEHVDAVLDLRRHETLQSGKAPEEAGKALNLIRETDTITGRSLSDRMQWAQGEEIPLATKDNHVEILWWLGESSFDGRGQKTLRAILSLLRAASVSFAVLGAEERDVGDVARRLGDEAEFQRLARRNIETLSQHRFDRILTNDPHVLHAISNEYPSLGGEFDVVHHTTFIAELVKTGRLHISAADTKSVTYHDPCYLGRYNGEYDAPRDVLASLGLDVREMARARHESFCCGWGGGASITDVPAKTRIPDLRVAQATETGAEAIAVACPNCTVMLEASAARDIDVIDVAELVAKRILPAPMRDP